MSQKFWTTFKFLNFFGQIFLAKLAQSVEHLSYDLMVQSSNPFVETFFFLSKAISEAFDLLHSLKYAVLLYNV